MPKIPFWIFIVVALLHLSALRVDVMDIDAAQYAEISREMMESGDYLHVYDRGKEYLDKPPFLFWISAASMWVFGIGNFGYKLPSILLALWAIYATYRLARLLYGEQAGRMAALILGTCQGMFLMTNDVRTDTVLMSWVITAIWMIKECDIKRRWYYVLGGTASIALGMMSKGPIALLVPGFCFGTDWVLKRQWKKLFNPLHLLDVFLIGMFLIPMSIGLYQQFDMHPEKIVNGETGVSGLRFFYWSQSFGRITGESPWNNGAGFDFLLSNMLWSFLPWMFLFLPALVINIVTLIKQKFKLQPQQEWITTGGFILAYIALGSSRYQLPHYIFVVFPLAAIITAKFTADMFEGKYTRAYKIMKPVQTVVGALVLIASLLTLVLVFPGNVFIIAIWTIGLLVWLFISFRKQMLHKMLWTGVAAIIVANIVLTHHFYYHLISEYQLGSKMGRFLKEQNIRSGQLTIYDVDDPINSLPFYAEQNYPVVDTFDTFAKGDYVLAMQKGLDEIKNNGYYFDLVKKESFYRVTILTGPFLNPATRSDVLKTCYLVKIK